MYKEHFGLTHAPLGKKCKQLWDNGQITQLRTQFEWLLESPGLGVLTAEPGIGKTAALRHLTSELNPHQYQVIYIADTDFSRLDFYRQLAVYFGLEPRYRRTQLWREIKERITELKEQKCILPVLIIDEAQNLSADFLRDFPSFLNFAFDSKDMMTVWLVGHPQLSSMLQKAPYEALCSRVQVYCQLKAIDDRGEFKAFIQYAFKDAGVNETLLSDTGVEQLRMASKGRARYAHRILNMALRLAAEKKLNHLPDDVISEAINILRG